jgi:hypothetical protein
LDKDFQQGFFYALSPTESDFTKFHRTATTELQPRNASVEAAGRRVGNSYDHQPGRYQWLDWRGGMVFGDAVGKVSNEPPANSFQRWSSSSSKCPL